MDEKLANAIGDAWSARAGSPKSWREDVADFCADLSRAGFVVVPVEMTDAMERAQRLEFARYITDEKADIKAASRSAHKAMLAAALVGRKDG